MATRLVLIGMLLAGCACGEEALSPAPACSFVVSPDLALEDATREAAERWSSATGCEIQVRPGGVPVVLASSILRPDGTEAPGATAEDRSRVRINARSGDEQRATSVLHELGHALGGNHVETSGILSGRKGYTAVIDPVSLNEVCSHLACLTFSPELP